MTPEIKWPANRVSEGEDRWRVPLAAFTLVLATLSVYLGTLDAPFQFDDVNIEQNTRLHARSLSELLIPLRGDPSTRPVGSVTFALNHYLGGLDTFGYHIFNLLLHLANGGLVFWIVYRTLTLRAAGPGVERKSPRLSRHGSPEAERAWQVAFFTALIWLVHPVQIQAVTYIWQRFESLTAFFTLLSLALYILGRQVSKPRGYWFFALAGLSVLLGLGCKESAVMAPALIGLYELAIFRKSPLAELKRAWLPVSLLSIFMASVALYFVGFKFFHYVRKTHDEVLGFSVWEHLLSTPRVLAYYISILLWPLPSRLMVDFDFPVSTSLTDPATTLPAWLFVFGLLALGIWLLKRSPLPGLMVLWFFLSQAVVSSVMPIDLVALYRLYLPSIAVVAVAVYLALQLRPRSRAGPVVLCLLAAMLGVWTVRRNRAWTSPVKLWQDNAVKAPGNARVHANLGKALLDAGRYFEAEEEFQKAVAIDPGNAGFYVNLGILQLDHFRNYARAQEYLKTALLRDPDNAKGWLNLGVTHMRTGQWQEALPLLTRALELNADQQAAYINLAVCYTMLARFKNALAVIDDGLSRWPVSPALYKTKAHTHRAAGNPSRAEKALERAEQLTTHLRER